MVCALVSKLKSFLQTFLSKRAKNNNSKNFSMIVPDAETQTK